MYIQNKSDTAKYIVSKPKVTMMARQNVHFSHNTTHRHLAITRQRCTLNTEPSGNQTVNPAAMLFYVQLCHCKVQTTM